jgi:hypothetical protein
MTRRRPTRRSAGAGGLALGVLLAVGVVSVASGCGASDGTTLGSAEGSGGVGASSPSAAAVSLHRTDPSGAMVDAAAIDVPAGGEVPFLPGGDHLMLEGLVTPLLPGASVVLDLEFADAGVVQVEAPVIALVDVLDTYDGGW